jgi:hypothetical protein
VAGREECRVVDIRVADIRAEDIRAEGVDLRKSFTI